MTTPFAYDAVDYPSIALPEAHPSHLHAVGRMFGVNAAPVERCRMLEVGCGDGTHLAACALGLPETRFVGLDLSAAAVERGKRLIGELGLSNVTLHQADLTTWNPPAEPFDYIVAHGVYSWVPLAVRDGLLALYAHGLAPGGIGYLSYNVYPGCYVRRMLWEMMRLHAAGTTDPSTKIEQAIAFAKFLDAAQSGDKQPGLLRSDLENTIHERDARVVYHDDLAPLNDPVYFHELVTHAAKFGLRFVAEAEPPAMETAGLPAEVANMLRGFARRGVVWKEQYLDFVKLRRFRMTLLTRDDAEPRERPDPAAIASLAVSASVKSDPAPVDLAPGSAARFFTEDASAEINLAIAKAALVVLTERWPERIPSAELLGLALERLGRDRATAEEECALGEVLTVAWMGGLVRLHGHRPRYATAVSARPVASPLARIQIRSGRPVTTLLHTTIRLDDEPTRRLLQVLDGTRGHEEIAAEVLAAFDPSERPDRAALMAGVNRNLTRLAREGLLVG